MRYTSVDPNIGPTATLTAALAAATLATTMVAELTGSTALRGTRVTDPSDGASTSAVMEALMLAPTVVPLIGPAVQALAKACHRRTGTLDISKHEPDAGPTGNDENVSPVVQDEEIMSGQLLSGQQHTDNDLQTTTQPHQP